MTTPAPPGLVHPDTDPLPDPVGLDGGLLRRAVAFSAPPGFRPLELDLYTPLGDPAPAILFVHGGGWRLGTREVFVPTCATGDRALPPPRRRRFRRRLDRLPALRRSGVPRPARRHPCRRPLAALTGRRARCRRHPDRRVGRVRRRAPRRAAARTRAATLPPRSQASSTGTAPRTSPRSPCRLHRTRRPVRRPRLPGIAADRRTLAGPRSSPAARARSRTCTRVRHRSTSPTATPTVSCLGAEPPARRTAARRGRPGRVHRGARRRPPLDERTRPRGHLRRRGRLRPARHRPLMP